MFIFYTCKVIEHYVLINIHFRLNDVMEWRYQNSSMVHMHIGFQLTRVLNTCRSILDDVAKAHVHNILNNISDTLHSCLCSHITLDTGKGYATINRYMDTIRTIFHISLQHRAMEKSRIRNAVFKDWSRVHRWSDAATQMILSYIGTPSVLTQYMTLFYMAMNTLDEMIWKEFQNNERHP